MTLIRLVLILSIATPTSSLAQDADLDAETEMLARINQMRTARNLPALVRDGRLDAAARTQSTEMAATTVVEHVSETTGDPMARVQAAGLEPEAVAENIAFNTTGDAAHQALVRSPSHRTNLLSARATHIGLSVVQAEGGVYVTQVFARVPDLEPEEVAVEEAQEQGEPEVEEALPPPVSAEVEVRAPAPQAPIATVPGHEAGRRVTGYWVQSNGQWWYYPLPANAQPGQQLQATTPYSQPPAYYVQPAPPVYQYYAPPVVAAPGAYDYSFSFGF